MAKFNGFSEEVEKRLIAAYNRIIKREVLIKQFPKLLSEVKEAWVRITIKNSIGTEYCRTHAGGWDGNNTIQLCSTREPKVEAVLLHEIVHECRQGYGLGSELDSEALEHACYLGERGMTTRPYGDDWKKFRRNDDLNGDSNVKKGKYVVWDRRTGEVWVKIKKDGKEDKGDLLFKKNYWKDPLFLIVSGAAGL